jgi:hypothetical protein
VVRLEAENHMKTVEVCRDATTGEHGGVRIKERSERFKWVQDESPGRLKTMGPGSFICREFQAGAATLVRPVSRRVVDYGEGRRDFPRSDLGPGGGYFRIS